MQLGYAAQTVQTRFTSGIIHEHRKVPLSDAPASEFGMTITGYRFMYFCAIVRTYLSCLALIILDVMFDLQANNLQANNK